MSSEDISKRVENDGNSEEMNILAGIERIAQSKHRHEARIFGPIRLTGVWGRPMAFFIQEDREEKSDKELRTYLLRAVELEMHKKQGGEFLPALYRKYGVKY